MSAQEKTAKRPRKILVLTLLIITTVITIESGESCTIFTASYGDTVLFGNNEDFYNYSMWAFIEQPQEGIQHYGGFYLGHTYGSHPQGGMNEKGLCFDANALPEMELNYDYRLKSYSGWIVELIMHRCANVSEVISMAKEYSWGFSMSYQVIFADATGDAVVIHPGTDGEINFTRKLETDRFLASTNFNRGFPESGHYPCWRYDTTVSMLSDGLQSEEDLSVDLFRSVLDAVHPEGSSVNTIYSNIFDPVNQLVYLYYWHQFDDVVKLNVTEEIAKRNEDEYIPLNDIFSQETQAEAEAEYKSYLINAGLLTRDLTDRPALAELVELALIPIALTVILGYGLMYKKKTFSKL